MVLIINNIRVLIASCVLISFIGIAIANEANMDPNYNLTERESAELNKVLSSEGEASAEEPLSLIQVPILEIMSEDDTSQLSDDLMVFMKTLDKVSARTSTLTLRINEPERLGRLVITMRSCKANPPEDEPETRVFLEIDENQDGAIYRIFTGWMFASSPSVNALEHPVHDLWPITCKTSDGAIFTGIE